MIFDAIIGIVLAIFTGILGLLPSIDPPDFGDFGTSVGGAMGWASEFFPVATLGLCIAWLIGIRVATVAWSVVVWIYNKIPFKFT